MPITRTNAPTRQTVAEATLRFLRRGLISRGVSAASADAAAARGTDRWLLAQSFGQGLEIVLANAIALEDATMPDTATGEDLDRLCAVHGLDRSAGAGAQGDVVVSCTGTVTYAAGQECVSDRTGLRYRVVAATSATDGDSVAVVGIDVGTGTNLDAGETLTWTSPPFGSAATCEVGTGGLTDGADADTDDRLRQRLLKLLREPQNGGSWAHYRQWAEEASAAVESAYVYPAAQGPATVHLAYTVEGTSTNRYSRTGSTALTVLVANAVVAEQPEFADVTVTTVAHQNLDLALKLTLPEPPSGGGPGGGWIDPTADRWAKALIGGGGGTSGLVTITTVNSSTSFTVNANAVPVDGSTVAFFSSADRKMYVAVVDGTPTGSAGSRTFTIDRALPTLVAGDYLMPACEQGEAYSETLMAAIATLAPGEKTASTSVLPRAYRHPKSTEGFPSALTTTQLVGLQTEHTEITNASYFAAGGSLTVTLPLEPSVPSEVIDPPNVWRIRHLAFYPT